MRIPLSWLQDFVALEDDHELARRLTAAGLECEVETPPSPPAGVVTGRILTCGKHPQADRLSVCTVDVGDGEPKSIVCGAPNAQAGKIGACALVGTDFGNGFVIEKRKLRGVPSEGMLCSESELGLSEDHSGILFLPDDTPIGKPLGEVLPRDRVLVTEPLSNRGDWMSVRGVAREVAAVTGRPWKAEAPATAAADAGPWKVEIEDPADCPRYGGRVVEGLKTGPSPAWLADRLAAAGVRPISNLVDVTNYVLLEHGHPLHAFDLDKLTGHVIGVRRARKGEKLVTLDGKARELTERVLLITDGSGPVALGGVMGGEPTMVSDDTTRVFLEGASFAAPRIRAGARALRMTSDASGRFERGVDPAGVAAALDRAVELLCGLCPGARVTHAVDAYPAPPQPRRLTLRATTLRRVLGTELPADEVRRILAGLGLGIVEASADAWAVDAPTFRTDLSAEEDLVEEVARIHGYDRLPERIRGASSGVRPDAPRVIAQRRARRTLLGLGLTETVTPSLVEAARERPLSAAGDFFRDPVPLRNPLSGDRDALRGMLATSLAQVLATNRARSRSDLALFEVGRVWARQGEDGPIDERVRVALLLAGQGLAGDDPMAAKSCDFFDMKGLLEVYVEELWGASLRLEDSSPAPLRAGRSAAVIVGGDRIGFLGEAGPELRAAFDLPEDLPVVVAELELELEGSVEKRDFAFRPPPRFPAVHRDLAFVVESGTRHDSLASALREAGGELLAESRLFDIYAGAPLAANEKSLAFTLVFRSPERSLTNEEVDKRVDGIVRHLEKVAGARIR